MSKEDEKKDRLIKHIDDSTWIKFRTICMEQKLSVAETFKMIVDFYRKRHK